MRTGRARNLDREAGRIWRIGDTTLPVIQAASPSSRPGGRSPNGRVLVRQRQPVTLSSRGVAAR